MPKYYIKSGTMRFTIDAIDQNSAIEKTLLYYKDKKKMIGSKICISETGFMDHNKWKCIEFPKP